MIDAHQFHRSVRHALRGVRIVFLSEQSFRLQVILGLCACVLMMILSIPLFEAIIVFLLMALVLILEMINSIFERLVDAFKPRIHPIVGEIKDIMAGTVLVASLFAAVIGVIIFVPPIFRLFAA